MQIFKNVRTDKVGEQIRGVTVSAEGDSLDRIIEQYNLTIQYAGQTTQISMDRITARGIISDLMSAFQAMDRHWTKNNVK